MADLGVGNRDRPEGLLCIDQFIYIWRYTAMENTSFAYTFTNFFLTRWSFLIYIECSRLTFIPVVLKIVLEILSCIETIFITYVYIYILSSECLILGKHILTLTDHI